MSYIRSRIEIDPRLMCRLSFYNIKKPVTGIDLAYILATIRTCSTGRSSTASSRSHAVYTITLYRNGGEKGTKFHLIDLAAGERW